MWLQWFGSEIKGHRSLKLYTCENAIYSNQASRSALQTESKRYLVNNKDLATENVWTWTHSFYRGSHLEIECWVAFSLPLTIFFSLSRFLSSAPLTVKLHKDWRMLLQTQSGDYGSPQISGRKDRDGRTETETAREDSRFRVVNDRITSMELLRHWVVKCLTTASKPLIKIVSKKTLT